MKRFRPALGPTIAFLLVAPLLVSLGFWQLDRAEQKRRSAQEFERELDRDPIALSPDVVAGLAPDAWVNVTGAGEYGAEVVLLDNRVRQRRVGYEVLSLLRVPSQQEKELAVLVNRGWVPANADRAVPPAVSTPNGQAVVAGRLGPPPATGIVINDDSIEIEAMGAAAYRIQTFDFARLSAFFGVDLSPYVLYLDSAAPAGFERDWPPPGFNPEKHEAYATQWFTMAMIVLGLYVVLNLRSDGQSETNAG